MEQIKSFAARVRKELEEQKSQTLDLDMAQSEGFRLFSRDNLNSNSFIKFENLESDKAKYAFLRGAFLASGYVISPEKHYHLEIIAPFIKLRKDFTKFLESLELPAKWVRKHGSFVFYFKESEKIADILRFIGANRACLEFLNAKVQKEDNGNINRRINSETANVDKAIKASVRIISVINKIGIANLPENLREVAQVRTDNPSFSLSEIGNILGIKKTSVYAKLAKIEKLYKTTLISDTK